jgi:two-component system, chemotaxis family, protein-glutamate methylesterase/glutaminase
MAQHDIIVIGASAGGVEALREVFRDLPADFPAAIFVVMHRPSGTKGVLTRLLGAASRLPVVEAAHGAAIEKGRIHVAQPGTHLLIEPDGIRLGHGPRENMARPAVDPLFRSAALSFGPRVVGVVLSGDLNDGTSGLDAVKNCGGIAVVQDPGDALAPSMPRSALSQVTVDHCLPATELGALLAQLARLPAGEPPLAPADLRLEVAIAAGTGSSLDEIKALGKASPFTCPECSGVLSEMNGAVPLRFRCQIGHAHTARTLARSHSEATEEALRVALRIIQERTELVARLAREARAANRPQTASLHQARADDYRKYCETLRSALISTFDLPDEGIEDVAGPDSNHALVTNGWENCNEREADRRPDE